MKLGRHLGSIAALVVLAAAGSGVAQPRLANGSDWARSTETEKRAYLAGISNTISAGAAWDAKNLPEGQKSFLREAQKGLGHSSFDAAITAIDGWYKANPSQLDKPVLSVIWREIAKPRLAQAQ